MTLKKSQNFTYYAVIMLDAFATLLCSKLCWHNWLKPPPTQYTLAIAIHTCHGFMLIIGCFIIRVYIQKFIAVIVLLEYIDLQSCF